MKKFNLLLSVFILFGIISCNEDNDVKPQDYVWIISNVIPDFDGIHKMKIADGESLYISGIINGSVGIFKLENGEWVKLVETPEIGLARDFSIYDGILYFASYQSLYRVVNSKPEKFTPNDPHVISMEVYNNKLFFTGSSILAGGDYYTLATFDGTKFSPVSAYHSGYEINVVNDKLYLSNYPVVEYDHEESQYLNDFRGQSNIAHDINGNLYIAGYDWAGNNELYSVILKYSNGESYLLGDTLKAAIDNVQIYNNTVIATGSENPNNDVSYYYTNNNWKKIDMPKNFGNIILYNDKIIGSPLTPGKAYELQLK